MPADLRALAEARLKQWDLLPPPLQQEFLANDKTLPYFAHVGHAQSAGTHSRQRKIAEEFSQFL